MQEYQNVSSGLRLRNRDSIKYTTSAKSLANIHYPSAYFSTCTDKYANRDHKPHRQATSRSFCSMVAVGAILRAPHDLPELFVTSEANGFWHSIAAGSAQLAPIMWVCLQASDCIALAPWRLLVSICTDGLRSYLTNACHARPAASG